MSKNQFTEPQRNRNGTANYVTLIRTSTVASRTKALNLMARSHFCLIVRSASNILLIAYIRFFLNNIQTGYFSTLRYRRRIPQIVTHALQIKCQHVLNVIVI